MINLFRNNFFNSSLFFGGYLFVCGITHIILVSFIAFFHFNLGHDLPIIEEWVFYQGWEIILTTKILSAFFVMKFLNQRSVERKPLRKLLMSRIIHPRSELMVIIFMLFFCLLFFGKPVFSTHYNFSFIKTFISFIGVISFYFIDLFVLELIEKQYPYSSKNTLVKPFVYSALFWLAGKMIFTYSSYFNVLVMFNFFVCYLMGRYRVKNFTGPLFYLILFVGPLSTLFGLDPLWKDHYSFFVMSSEIHPYYYIILTSLILFYLSYKKRSFLWKRQS